MYQVFTADGQLRHTTSSSHEAGEHADRLCEQYLQRATVYQQNAQGALIPHGVYEPQHVWYIVTSQGPSILGVFGAALLSDAQECARRVEVNTGFDAFVNRVRGRRPRVGDTKP